MSADPTAPGGGSVKAPTEYVVLTQHKQDNEAPLSWHPLAIVEARSSEHAIRKAAEGKTVPMVLVAVPARSWVPVRVTPKTVTTLDIEAA